MSGKNPHNPGTVNPTKVTKNGKSSTQNLARLPLLSWDTWRIAYDYMNLSTAAQWSLTCKRHYRYFLDHVKPTHRRLLRAMRKNYVQSVRFLLFSSPHASKWDLDPSIIDGIALSGIFCDTYLPMLKLLFDNQLMQSRGFGYTMPRDVVNQRLKYWANGWDHNGVVQVAMWIMEERKCDITNQLGLLFDTLCERGYVSKLQYLMHHFPNVSESVIVRALGICIKEHSMECFHFLKDKIDLSTNPDVLLNTAQSYGNIDAALVLLDDERVVKQLSPQQREFWGKLIEGN